MPSPQEEMASLEGRDRMARAGPQGKNKSPPASCWRAEGAVPRGRAAAEVDQEAVAAEGAAAAEGQEGMEIREAFSKLGIMVKKAAWAKPADAEGTAALVALAGPVGTAALAEGLLKSGPQALSLSEVNLRPTDATVLRDLLAPAPRHSILPGAPPQEVLRPGIPIPTTEPAMDLTGGWRRKAASAVVEEPEPGEATEEKEEKEGGAPGARSFSMGRKSSFCRPHRST